MATAWRESLLLLLRAQIFSIQFTWTKLALFPPTTKTARGGWSIWCRGGKAKHKPHKASHALLLHMQSTEKTIHVQRRGMNKFPNEEIARKSKGEEIRFAHTLPSLPTALRDVKQGASSGRNGKENTARPVLFNYTLCQILLAFADAQRLLPTEGCDCNLDTACTWNLSVHGSASEK